MEVQIINNKTQENKTAVISRAIQKDMPAKKDGWQFSWKSLFKTEGAEFYKLNLSKNEELQGVLMLSLMNEEMLYMNNLEVAPHNYGSKGEYENVAACLIAFACQKSFELGKDNYRGYLTFESKTHLIALYEKKYGATLARGQRMFIAPDKGLELMDNFLV